MALFTNGVQKCADAIAKLQAARVRLAEDEARDHARLQDLRTQLPAIEIDELLNGKPEAKPGELLNGATRLHAETYGLEQQLAGRDAVRRALMEKLRHAVRTHAAAQAAEIRDEAATLRKQLGAHKAGVAKLVERLQELDGCTYRPMPPLPSGGDPGLLAMMILNTHVGPTTTRFEAEVNELLRKADAIEAAARDQCAGGQAAADTLDELLARIGDNTIAPMQPTIESWYGAAVARIEAAWSARYASTEQRLIPPQGRLRSTLCWDADGEILPASQVERLGLTALDVERSHQARWDRMHEARHASA